MGNEVFPIQDKYATWSRNQLSSLQWPTPSHAELELVFLGIVNMKSDILRGGFDFEMFWR